LDVLFERKIPARKFASTSVDVFHEHVEDAVLDRFNDVKQEKGTA
jgi:MFS transporter, SP family, general alpha glucoside:H+ symporter